jgi:rubrerythrin
MVYVCERCRFVFERTGVAEACPDCGKPNIREASEEECAEYLKSRTEFARGNDGKTKK